MLSLWAKVTGKMVAMKDETGASLVEYALLVVLIAIIAIVAIRLTGTRVSSTFNNIATNLNT